MQTILLTDFYKTDYVDYASYDNLRKIGSLVDGQKNASRKVIHTLIEKNIHTEIKVSQLSSKIEEFTEYLHGSIAGVAVNMGRSYVGTNNMPLVQKSGNFGTRYIPEASATRYIYASGSDTLFSQISKMDHENLQHQSFEGHNIEPRFFVPTLPLLLCNGSEGVSSGFAQKILPRNPKELEKLLLNKLDGKKRRASLVPYYNGFKGTIEQGDNPLQWLIIGQVERLAPSRLRITEVPIGYKLKSYIAVLDKLEETRVISSYIDKSEDDNFMFEIKVQSKLFNNLTDFELANKLKLVKKVTENFTCLNEENKVIVCESAEEIVDRFFDVKLGFMVKRKTSILKRLNNQLNLADSRYHFINSVANDKLIISKRKKVDIVAEMKTDDKYHLVDNKFDYLLNMNITSLTKEKMAELLALSKSIRSEIKDVTATTPEQLYIADISNV